MSRPPEAGPATFGAWALARVRGGGYRPRAWTGMLAESWARARTTAAAQPRLTASWRALAGGLAGGAAALVVMTARRHGSATARRTALPLALGTAAQAADLYVHLGLHRRGVDPAAPHYATLGPANALTAARGLAATWLWARLAANAPLDDAELAVALGTILLTDLLDGPVARRGHVTSPLGRYLDGEADLCAWLALLGTQTRRGQVPGWFLGMTALRWLAPVGLGLARSFAAAVPADFVPSAVGKAAGAGQITLAAAALLASWRAGQPDARLWRGVARGALAATTALLAAATGAHLARIARSGERIYPLA